MSTRRVATIVSLALVSVACSRDPDLSALSSGATDSSGPLDLDCTDLSIVTALGATLEYDLNAALTGGSGNLAWAVLGLPAPLTFDPTTGVISGGPIELTGELPLGVTVIDLDSEEVDSDTCTLTINERLNALGLVDPICLPTATSKAELLASLSGGDGTAITCAPLTPGELPSPLGDGNGRPPPGISFDAETCSHAGALTSTTRGTWVWMIEVEQSGATAPVPFCATNDVDTFHDIVMTVDGVETSELIPGRYEYDPDAAISFGEDYAWSIQNPSCTNDPSACSSYGYLFDATLSPFEPPFVVNPLPEPLGIGHGLELMGPPPDASYRDRPWIASFELHYCTSGNAADCDIEAPSFDAQTTYHFDVVGYPIE